MALELARHGVRVNALAPGSSQSRTITITFSLSVRSGL
jgi:NAD(P)-dependent dehydrogenase (short-subunit alcohol dehydrogenase family)